MEEKMAHKTTIEENYAKMTEDGFEQWTVEWNEFFDFLKEHKDDKIDVTIDKNSLADMKNYLSENDYLEEYEKTDGTLIIRLPEGLITVPDCACFADNWLNQSIARIYFPASFYGWIGDSYSKSYDNEKFVFASNYVNERDLKCKFYETSVTHFPAGKYAACFYGKKHTKELHVLGDNQKLSNLKSAIDENYADGYFGVEGTSASFIIKNLTTGQIWDFENESDGDGTDFEIDGVLPKYDEKLTEFSTYDENIPNAYYICPASRFARYIGAEFYVSDPDFDEDDGVDFPNGFNFCDIKISCTTLRDENFSDADVYLINLESIGEEYAETSSDGEWGDPELIVLDGESYDYDDLPDEEDEEDEDGNCNDDECIDSDYIDEEELKGLSGEELVAKGDEYRNMERFKSAVKCYELACEKNNAMAFNRLAVRYYNGEGVKLDDAKAEELMLKSALLGYENAVNNLKLSFPDSYKKYLEQTGKDEGES